MELRIDRSINLLKIEEYLDLLPENTDRVDIVLPAVFTDIGFAAKAAICQLINTWTRKTDNSSSILIQIENEKDIDSFINDTAGVCIVLMTIKEGRKIYNLSNKADHTEVISKKAIKKLEGTMPEISVVGEIEKKFSKQIGPIQIICFDHSSVSKYQYNEWFYQDGRLLDEMGIEKFYLAAIKHLLKAQKSKLEKAIKGGNEITGIIKELFENTDKHATTGFGSMSNVPLNPNMRGVFIEIHSGTKAEFNKKVVPGDPYSNYFNNPKLFSGKEESKTFLEISVIDSGSGFAQKKSGISLETMGHRSEWDYVIECLTQYDTSASKRGLKRVATSLGERKGFLRLRTGRCCFYWDFLLWGFEANDHSSQGAERGAAKSKFFDWVRDGEGLTRFPEASGSLITIFYPLD
jgi:hypothetical protein